MPANRSRTLEWRRCLKQLADRGGSLEIAVQGWTEGDDARPDLIWRVRLLGVTDKEIIVEQPFALGRTIDIDKGTTLVGVMAIGQNRWMFSTQNLGMFAYGLADRRTTPALRLAMPEAVERCQRRNHYRVETASLALPVMDIWPLLDPKSVLVAERACELEWERTNGAGAPTGSNWLTSDTVMPEVGPKFSGTILNLGGGGLGLRIAPESTQQITRHKLFWMHISLAPLLPTPVCATGKVIHTHIESNHDVYAGVAFDFSFNPAHERFVVEQICRYIALQQKAQHEQRASQVAMRKTA